MELNELQATDIVSLSQSEFVNTNLNTIYNLFYIREIEGDKILLDGLDKSFNISQIKPVQIDGGLDGNIYYNKRTVAQVMDSLQDLTLSKDPKNICYLNKRLFSVKTLREFTKEEGITEVHTLQHILSEMNNNYTLKININN